MKPHSRDVTAVLKDQHRQIRLAFARAARPGRGRRQAFHHLVQLLATHEAAEEAHIHPTARRAGRTAAVAARVGEEKRAKELLVRLYRIGPDGDGYLRGLLSLSRAVLAHAAGRNARSSRPWTGWAGPAGACSAWRYGWRRSWPRPGRTRG